MLQVRTLRERWRSASTEEAGLYSKAKGRVLGRHLHGAPAQICLRVNKRLSAQCLLNHTRMDNVVHFIWLCKVVPASKQ